MFARKAASTGGDERAVTGRRIRPRPAARVLFALAALLLATAASAGSNAVFYEYDAAGNIVRVSRQTSPVLVVSGFAPASGSVGTAVTVYGSAFDPVAANNIVKFNGAVATVTQVANGSITTSVPNGAETGPISVSVGVSTATSSHAFVVSPAGAPTITSFSPTTGSAGVSVAVTGANFDPTPGSTAVALNGTSVQASVADAGALSFAVPAATASGRITVSTSSGSAASAADFIVPPAGMAPSQIGATTRVALGAHAHVALSATGASAIVLFDATANTRYSLQLSNVATSPTTASVAYQVIAPDNSVVMTGTVGQSNSPSIHLPALAATGTYSLVLSPGSATLSADVLLEANAHLAVDGPAISTTLAYANQSQRFIFVASAGERIGVGLQGLAFTPALSGLSSGISVYQPSGAPVIASWPCFGSTASNLDADCDSEFVAPVDGEYTLILGSPLSAYGNGAIQLSSEVTGTLAVDTPQDFTLARVGQDARIAFTAAAGDSLGIDVSEFVSLPQAQLVAASIYKPDGSTLSACTMQPPYPIYCELGTLPASGSYTVYLDPGVGSYGSFKATLEHGPMVDTSSPPSAFAPANVPQAARSTFSGAVGQNLVVGVTDLAYIGTSSSPSSVMIYKPDRSSLGSMNCWPTVASGTCRMRLPTLQVGGTYSIVVQPPKGVKLTGSLAMSTDIAGVLSAGAAATISATRPGQGARLSFAANAGDSTSIQLFGISTVPAGLTLSATVYRPDGTTLASGSASTTTPLILNFGSLPSTGTYTVVIDPTYGATWQAQLELDSGTATTIDSAVMAMPAGVPGQPFRYTFPGVAGQALDFGVAGLAYAPSGSGGTSVTIYRPDGSSLASLTCFTTGAGACGISIPALPTSGTYSVVIRPPATVAFSGGTLALSTPVAGAFVVGDPAQQVTIGRPGQTARYTLSGSSGQMLRLNWSGTIVSSGGVVAVAVLKPDGSTLSQSSFPNGASGGFDIAALPSSGAYTVVLTPSNSSTMSADVSLANR